MGSGSSNASGVASATGVSDGADGRDDGFAGEADGTAGGGGASGFDSRHQCSPDETSPALAATLCACGESSIARQNDRSAARR